MKKLLVLGLLAAAACAAYAVYAYVIRPPEKRACMHVAELCGLDPRGAERCSQMLDGLKKSNAATVGQLTTCVAGAKSCSEAAGCASGAALSAGVGFAKDFLTGLQKATR
jgi:hypothetical protein